MCLKFVSSSTFAFFILFFRLLISIIRIIIAILFKSFYNMNDEFQFRMNNFSMSGYLLNNVDAGQDRESNLDHQVENRCDGWRNNYVH